MPRVDQALKLAHCPGPEFKGAMIESLLRTERLSTKEAAKELQIFLNRLPLFYNVLAWPETWIMDTAPPPVNDASGGVEELSDMQLVEVAEPQVYEATDDPLQRDDGIPDEVPDTQTEQVTDPSAPSSSWIVAHLLESEPGPNEAHYRHHLRSDTV